MVVYSMKDMNKIQIFFLRFWAVGLYACTNESQSSSQLERNASYSGVCHSCLKHFGQEGNLRQVSASGTNKPQVQRPTRNYRMCVNAL